ncbi:Npun_F0494 family protein [Picosynechococcus sp. PCC 73109]|uniref:Npun_F0494 family protein n=1 Tax=Picosynechococcus sp. PCC 73109 TaxID=374982 RepID=UPI0007458F34|nr:Npun_F0494 family protein [Picosynechococcus sp. PCC 73109]AMA09343.1 hypothetical protein AWQ23_08455 [Picosynechococcus sp. PCC 73109]
MTQVFTPKPIQYAPETIQRALVAFACTPLRWELLAAMKDQSVALPDIAGEAGLRAGYSGRSLPEGAVEELMMWLIQVGLLRREVDGQGLTDSFRLTPLGRQVLAQWQAAPQAVKVSWLARCQNALQRWLSRFSV